MRAVSNKEDRKKLQDHLDSVFECSEHIVCSANKGWRAKFWSTYRKCAALSICGKYHIGIVADEALSIYVTMLNFIT